VLAAESGLAGSLDPVSSTPETDAVESSPVGARKWVFETGG
jgi:hypothetical protein